MYRAMADSIIGKALQNVKLRINAVTKARPVNLQQFEPRLVAVSKTKPLTMVIEAYELGQQHFGENYVSELAEKGRDSEILTKCKNIKWHFIGTLQKKNVNKLLGTPNLWMIETIESIKMATTVNNGWERQATGEKLRVMIQVNTSQEAQKSGCSPEEVSELVSYILQQCPFLQFTGLMTIGAFDHVLANGPNPDFQKLIECKEKVCSDLELEPSTVELSMGMSNDFEHAIEVGSSNVRVGSTIFGARETKPKDKAAQNISEEASSSDQVKDKTSDSNQTAGAKGDSTLTTSSVLKEEGSQITEGLEKVYLQNR